MIDLMASEYGWETDDIMETPIDQIAQLVHAIMHRRGVRVYRSNITKAAGTPSLADRIKGIFARQVDNQT